MVVALISSVEAFQFGAHLQAQQRVEVRERLVHQQHLRLHHDPARHGHTLALPAGKLRGIAGQVVLQLQQLRAFLHAALDLILRQPLHA